jgi:hypothetical protein
MLIRVLKISSVPTPKGFVGYLNDHSTRRLGLCHYFIDFGFG